MPSNSTMRVRSRSRCSSRVCRAWAIRSSSVDSTVRCRLRCTVATSFTDSAIMRVSSCTRVKRSNSSGSKPAAESLVWARRDCICDSECSSMSRNCERSRSRLPVRSVERTAQLAQFGLQARTSDHHLAGLVDQPVEQLRAHAHRLIGRCALGREIGLCGARQQCTPGRRLRHRVPAAKRSQPCRRQRQGEARLLVLERRRLFSRDRYAAGRAQGVEIRLHAVVTLQQCFEIGDGDCLGAEVLDLGLQAVRKFTQPQRPGQPCTALEGVQHAQRFIPGAAVVRPRRPLAQCAAQLRHEFDRFFLEDREQVRVDRVGDVDVFLVPVDRHQ